GRTSPLSGGVGIRASDASPFIPLPVEKSKRLLVQFFGGAIYVRYSFDATWDAVQKILIDKVRAAYKNNPVEFGGCNKIPVGTADSDTATVWGTTGASNPLANQGDDSPPLYINGTYIAGNHGASIAKSVTVAGHGKTEADIGSLWDITDSGYSNNYTIWAVPDPNTLYLLSQRGAGKTDVDTYWGHEVTTLTGKSFAHLEGATNVAGFVPSAQATIQLLPAINNRNLSFFVDGAEIYPADGVYRCAKFEVREQYSIVNPPAIYSWLRSNVGKVSNNWTPPDSLEADAVVKNSYLFGENGACANTHEPQFFKNLTLGFIPGVQGTQPYYSGKVLSGYAPGVSPVTAGATYDFKSVAALTTAPSSDADLASGVWLDAKNPPNRLLHLVTNGGVNEFGSLYGYTPLRSPTGRVSRSANVNTAGFFSTARKAYPKAVTGSIYPSSIVPAGTSLKVVAYRHIFSSSAVPDATVASWFWDGSDIVVTFDFHKTSTFSTISLPAVAEGCSVTPIDSLAVSLLSPIVDGGKIGVACTASYGYAQYRVSAT
ncbi:MAG: hypothetical protein ACKO0Z_15990, partial [Betaproteobacteria bacterium]